MSPRHLWQKAAAFAACAHEGQLRRDGNTPYASHPVRVALTVACVFGFSDDDEVLAAALLHDVIEDSQADYDELVELFGRRVADLVAVLSKDKRIIEPKRELAYDDQLARGPWQARLIKLADVYDNYFDTASAQARRTCLGKVRRALTLTVDDPQLSKARTIVSSLIRPRHR